MALKIHWAPDEARVLGQGLGNRKPFIYDPNTDSAYVGAQGMSHTDAHVYHDLPGDEWGQDGLHQGFIDLPEDKTQEGAVGFYGRNVHLPHVTEALSKATGYPVDDDMMFESKTAWEVPKDLTVTELGPEHIYEPDELTGPASWMKSRRPFVYHPEDNQVVIGPPGTFHTQIDPNVHGLQGGIFDATWHGGPVIKDLSDQGNMPKPVLQELGKRFNVPLESEREDQYKFGAEALQNGGFPYHPFGKQPGPAGGTYETVPWQHGTYGKGLEYQGKAYLWMPGHGGNPHHDEVVHGLFGGDPINDPVIRDIYHRSNKFDIAPDGQIEGSRGNDDRAEEWFASLHPHLYTGSDWSFEGSQSRPKPHRGDSSSDMWNALREASKTREGLKT